MTAAARTNRPLSLSESLPLLARTRVAARTSGFEGMSKAAGELEALIEGLLGTEDPSSPESCERSLARAELAARTAADLTRSSAAAPGFAAANSRDLALVSEAVSQHSSRLELLARTLRESTQQA